MGLSKPITVGGGLTVAEVQSIIDAQNETLQGKMDAQTNTLKADIPSSISGGVSATDVQNIINAQTTYLQQTLPNYVSGKVVKSAQFGTFNVTRSGEGFIRDLTVPISTIDPNKVLVTLYTPAYISSYSARLYSIQSNALYFERYGDAVRAGSTWSYSILEFY